MKIWKIILVFASCGIVTTAILQVNWSRPCSRDSLLRKKVVIEEAKLDFANERFSPYVKLRAIDSSLIVVNSDCFCGDVSKFSNQFIKEMFVKLTSADTALGYYSKDQQKLFLSPFGLYSKGMIDYSSFAFIVLFFVSILKIKKSKK